MAFLLSCEFGSCVLAADLPPAYVLNLPFQSDQATPAWLGHPETPQTTFATLDLPIEAPDPNASLLVTVFFQEKQGGFLRIIWHGPQVAQLLSDNFYEGIGMSNQRSLLMSAQTLTGYGKLSFQCGDTTLGIQRIKLEWLESKPSLGSSQVQDILVTPEGGPTQWAQNLDGQAKPADPAIWKNQIVTVPITESPQRIEQGVEFSVQLDTLPSSGRLVLKEDGLSLAKHLTVWINQQRAGTITPVVPDLFDAGYLTGNPPDSYVGWRDGSFSVPVSFLKAGVNTVQFSTEDEVPSTSSTADDATTTTVAPLAIKNVAFQFNYALAQVSNGPPSQAQVSAPTADTSLPTVPLDSTPSSPSSDSSLLPNPGEMTSSPSTPPGNNNP